MLPMQARMTRPFLLLLSLPATAMGFALAVQISVLSWLLLNRYGLRIEDIGYVWAAGPLAGIFGQVIVGIVSDGVWLWGGRRRAFILVGSVIAALMILALPNIDVIAGLFGAGALVSVATGVALALDLAINVSFNPTRSIITDVTREGPERTRGYTWMQTVSGLFGVLAFGIGATLGNYVLIYFAAGLVLAFSILPALLIEEPRTLGGGRGIEALGTGDGRPRRGIVMVLLPLWAFLAYDVYGMARRLSGADVGGWIGVLACLAATLVVLVPTLTARDRGEAFVREDLVEFRKVLAAHAFSWIGVQSLFVYMIAFVRGRFPALSAEAGGSVLAISFLTLNAVGGLAPALLLEPLTRRYGQVLVHVGCLVTMAAGFALVYALGYSIVVVYACMALMGLGWAAIVSLPFAIMSTRVDRARVGYYMGIFNLSVVIPQLFVSLGLGAVIGQAKDPGLVFLIGASSLALSAVCWLFVRRGTGGDAAPALPATGH